MPPCDTPSGDPNRLKRTSAWIVWSARTRTKSTWISVPFTASRWTWRASASSSRPSICSVMSVLAPVRDDRMLPSWCADTVTETLSPPRP